MYAEIDYQSAPIFAGDTPSYVFQLVDTHDAHVPLSALATMVLFYYDLATLTVLNGRQGQDVKNINNVWITADGFVTWDLQVADTTRVAGVTGLATHEAVFTFSYTDSGSLRVKSHKARFFITDAAFVAAAP